MDSYTAVPRASRLRARGLARTTPVDQTSSETSSLSCGSTASRAVLLDHLAESLVEEENSVKSLQLMFGSDLKDEIQAPAFSSSSAYPSFPDSNRNAAGASRTTAAETGDTAVEVFDKNQYLLTPIRTKIFPKASPGVLRNLLCTPSLRAFTPDQSILPEDASLLGSPLQGLFGKGYGAVPDSSCGMGDALVSVAPGHNPPAAVLCRPSTVLPPSPPPSAEFPALARFPLSSSEAESSPRRALDLHDCKRTEPFVDPRRSSSQGHRSPFPELIPSGLRAAPCSPLLTTRPVVDESSPPLSSVPQGRGGRTLDPRRHAHSGLAFGVVRDFQRVLDELQGLGLESSIAADTLDSPNRLNPSGCGPRNSASHCGSSERLTGISRKPVAPQAQAAHLRDAALRPRAVEALGGRLLGPIDDASWTQPPDISRSSTSFSELETEFMSLLLGQAKEEETQAEQLRAIADRLDDIARDRKHLVEVISRREP
ncbi:hypothetical protein FKP32DRAFT_1588409 [Trametes sanguinea]|nr:hypothetical protein FKP32DRAFT_1588409 [Trametes sanguinea]